MRKIMVIHAARPGFVPAMSRPPLVWGMSRSVKEAALEKVCLNCATALFSALPGSGVPRSNFYPEGFM